MFGKSLWTLTLGAALLGGISLYVASAGFQDIQRAELKHDLLRDVGVAFLVAAIVAAIYELHARARSDRETMRGVLGSIYNDAVGGSVSNEIRSQILDRQVVRKNGHIKLGLQENNSLLPGQRILWVEFEYDFCGLRSTPRRVVLRHFLDSFMDNSKLNLPRFDQIVIGDNALKDEDLDHCIKNGVFTKKLRVDGREGIPIRIVVERHEIVYVPGAYNLIMGELTDGIRIHLQQISCGIQLEVNIKSHVTELDEDSHLHDPTFFLPHQSIEFRFKPTKNQNASRNPDTDVQLSNLGRV